MLLLPSPYHQAALDTATAFIRYISVTFTRGTTTATLPVSGGSVSWDGRRSKRWQAQFEIALPQDSPYLPTTPSDLLTNFGTQATLRAGVELADGTVSDVPLGKFWVDSSDVVISPGSRVVSLVCVDLSVRVSEYKLESPLLIPSGTDLADVVNAVIDDRTGTDPGLSTLGVTIGENLPFGLSGDPWLELFDLAESFGYRLYYDRNGDLQLSQILTPTGTSPFLIRGPLSVRGSFESRPPNVAVARGEGASGTVPVQSVAMDLDPASPTFAGATVGSSPYGRITTFMSSPMLINQTLADNAARALLSKSAGAGASWVISRPFDPTMDPGDEIRVEFPELQLNFVVDAINMSFTGTTSIYARSLSTT